MQQIGQPAGEEKQQDQEEAAAPPREGGRIRAELPRDAVKRAEQYAQQEGKQRGQQREQQQIRPAEGQDIVVVHAPEIGGSDVKMPPEEGRGAQQKRKEHPGEAMILFHSAVLSPARSLVFCGGTERRRFAGSVMII